MPSNVNHTLHHHQHHHLGWDNSIEPMLTIAPGESVEFQVLDASGGQLSPDSTVADVSNMDFSKVNPVTGPVYVDNAEPGDALKFELVKIGWWRCISHGLFLTKKLCHKHNKRTIWDHLNRPLPPVNP